VVKLSVFLARLQEAFKFYLPATLSILHSIETGYFSNIFLKLFLPDKNELHDE
jgi:hypothetical protein